MIPPGVAMPTLGALIPTLTRRPLRELVDLAAAAETLGFGEVWVPESWCRDPFGVLHSIGASTTSIALGTGIATMPARTPTTSAMAASTLAEAFPGRVRLGLGTGHPETVEHWHGVPFQTSIERATEYVEVCRRVWSGEALEPAGDTWAVSDFATAAPPPGTIPIYLAALGPRMLSLAGRVADGVLLTLPTPDSIEASVGTVRQSAEEAGREVTISALLTVCLGTKDEAFQAVRRSVATYGYWQFYRAHLGTLGFSAAAQRLERAWRSLGDQSAVRTRWAAGDVPEEAQAAVPDDLITAVAATDRDTAFDRINRFRQAGVDVPVVRALPAAARDLRSFTATFETVAGLA